MSFESIGRRWTCGLLFALLGISTSLAADPGPSAASTSVGWEEALDDPWGVGSGIQSISAKLLASCDTCATCGAGAAVCAALCGQAAFTKNPSHMRDCGICLMGGVAGSAPCLSSCWDCMTRDRQVACLDYNAWSREMCTTEEWVCCNGADGCTFCAPYGGYCGVDHYECGYGNQSACGEWGYLRVVRRKGVRVADMIWRDTVRSKAAGVATDGPRFGRELVPGLGREDRPRPDASAPDLPRLQWRQRGPDAVYGFTCDGDNGGSGGGGGGGGGGDDGGGGQHCTHCSCQGEYTSYDGEVCGSTSDELVDECWNSCY